MRPIVSPNAPGGILNPDGVEQALSAGSGQIEAQVMKLGMVAEASCISKPWTIIHGGDGPVGGELLVDAQQVQIPGTVLAFLEPIIKARMVSHPVVVAS
jgi:hypothetical protein